MVQETNNILASQSVTRTTSFKSEIFKILFYTPPLVYSLIEATIHQNHLWYFIVPPLRERIKP